MVQPFVENSVIHGFGKKVPDGTMFRIEIETEADAAVPGAHLLLRIRDNGIGFPEDMLADLAAGTYAEGTGEEHLGIWNILRRYRMLYGDERGIAFANAPEGGAVVTIRLPAPGCGGCDRGGPERGRRRRGASGLARSEGEDGKAD
ncbi:sensor histidine kinase [Cohnella rhizosphaerae]|uniref:ATP-binding protein n=1 Tax=Cohnella rhizosphaerae TaxID=1457232 RepID=A0A9X4QTF0_9BACL|nr:ATP-binding protein [Cohnella rhizosphaerae]MDG0810268.1 ATP-binding protein [Cohnella rhizosphaerae]